jgi:hypothetical protein
MKRRPLQQLLVPGVVTSVEGQCAAHGREDEPA